MKLKDNLAPLAFPLYRNFIISRFFLIMALRMVTTVVAYKLFQLTQSSFSIGLVGLSEFVPVFSLALYAGHVIDRSDKRTLLLKGFIAYACCTAILLVLTGGWMENRIPHNKLAYGYYATIFITGIIRAFVGPGTNAILAQLVPKPHLPIAANISSSTYLSASIIGHASAGFLIAGLGVHNTFYVICTYVIISAVNLLRIPRLPVAGSNVNTRAWSSVTEGVDYVFKNKILLGAISLDLFAVLFGGAAALIPEVADRILKSGPIGFGWLNAATDIGSVISIIYIILFSLKRKQGKRLFYVVTGFGICIIVFGLSDVYWISFVALLVSGMLDGISVVIRGTILQLTTPDEMRGRIASVNSMFINSSNELGQFESGFTSRLMGTVPSIIFGGCMTIVVVAITWFRAPSLRKFEY